MGGRLRWLWLSGSPPLIFLVYVQSYVLFFCCSEFQWVLKIPAKKSDRAIFGHLSPSLWAQQMEWYKIKTLPWSLHSWECLDDLLHPWPIYSRPRKFQRSVHNFIEWSRLHTNLADRISIIHFLLIIITRFCAAEMAVRYAALTCVHVIVIR